MLILFLSVPPIVLRPGYTVKKFGKVNSLCNREPPCCKVVDKGVLKFIFLGV